MSVHRDRDSWRVRYRDAGKMRSRSFQRKGDADRFDLEMTRRLQLGPVLARELDRSALTLDGFVQAAWRDHAATLEKPTRAKYAWALDGYLTELADEPLVALGVPRLITHQRLLLDGGRVDTKGRRHPEGASPNTVRDVLTRLSGILQMAVELGEIPANPVRAMRKVPAAPREDARPLAPIELERLLADFEGRDRAIALLGGHLGLRPLEIRSAPWLAMEGSTFTVGRTRTKRSAARTRTIALPDATARELKAWRLESGRPGDGEPIVGPMTQNALRLWGAKRLRPAVATATGGRIEDATVYTLRHTHASALHYAGFTPPEAAERMGHGLPLHWLTYAHVIRAISGKRYDGLDALIAAARAELMFRQSSASAGEGE
jgi:integrase